MPGFQQTVVAFSPRFASRREVATNRHRPQTVETLAGVLGIQPALFDDMGFMHIDPDGKVNMASLQDLQDLMSWYVQMGYLSQPVDLARAVDPSFAETAVGRLGAYQ